MPDFIPGLEMREAFYCEAARPILNAHFLRGNYSHHDIFKLKHHVGSVNQFVDSTDLLSKVELCRTLRTLYE